MSRIRLLLGFTFTVLFSLFWPSSAMAQEAEQVVVNFVAAEERTDDLALSVFFTLTDAAGRPIPRPSLESATIQLLGGGSEPVPAIVEDPQSPVFIALLMDASGSMQGVMENVREAARSAIDAAPPTAYFGVIQFNETSTLVEEFTNDPNRVKSAINVVDAVPNMGTCLYDSLYDAIDLLDEEVQNPQERRAIILFTDGKDQLRVDSDEPCSRHTYDEVISAARPLSPFAPTTPIHTIGLTDEQANNLNTAELRSLAKDTVAYSAIGGETNLVSLFQEIIEGLNSQLVARANVFARQGENQAVLSIKVRDRDAPLTTTFSFFSNTNYDLPPPPVNIQISSLQYDQPNDLYLLSLSATNPESILQIVVNVWDVRRGVQVTTDQFFENPGPTVVVELGTEAFEAEREYSIHVQAIDKDGFLVQNEDGETILAEREIVYEPPQAEAVEFSIQSVNADFENGLLFIDLDVPEEGRVQSYDGFVVDESTGGKIHEFGPTPFTGRRIQETLPQVIQQSETIVTYRVTMHLTSVEDLRSEATFDDFKPIPPEPPGFMERASEALRNNPSILAGIGIIVLSIAGWIVIRGRQAKKKEVPLIRPPIDKTNIFIPGTQGQKAAGLSDWASEEEDLFGVPSAGAAITRRRLRLKIVKTPGRTTERERTVDFFPCVVGREGADFNITGDGRISRRHLEISLKGSEFMVTDLGSSNGTFLGDRKLPPHVPTPLAGARTIGVGSQTVLEVESLAS